MRKAALVGDLPAGQGSGEGSFAGGVTAGGFGHGWKCDFYFVGLGPDGDILHGVVVVDLGLREAIGLGGRGEAVDGGYGAMAVAESGGEAGPGGGGSVAAGVDADLFGLGEELGLDEGVELPGFGGVAGFEWDARGDREEAITVLEKVGVEGGGEVFRRGFGLRVAAGGGEKGDGYQRNGLKFAGWIRLDGRERVADHWVSNLVD